MQDKKKKAEEQAKELNDLFAVAIKQPKVPVGGSAKMFDQPFKTFLCGDNAADGTSAMTLASSAVQASTQNPLCANFTGTASARRASSASSHTISMLSARGAKLTFSVTGVLCQIPPTAGGSAVL